RDLLPLGEKAAGGAITASFANIEMVETQPRVDLPP
ncbi:hypothetical protein ATCR1_24085, partial [Agrobacterium tumefaciens CCNWGS0286]